MKVEPTFLLQNAPWPALLLETPGIVREANRAAGRVFGARVQGGDCPLETIWSSANQLQPVDLLFASLETEVREFDLQLRLKSGLTDAFTAVLCGVQDGGRQRFLLQLLPGKVPSGMPVTTADTESVPDPSFHPPPVHLTPESAIDQRPAGKLSSLAEPTKGAAAPDATVNRQKFDSALQLAKTVALDFNNALTTILGHTSLILGKTPANDPRRNSLIEVEKAAGKAAEIAQDLADFSRQDWGDASRADGNLNVLLRRSVEAMSANFPKLEWKLHLESKLCTTKLDEAK